MVWHLLRFDQPTKPDYALQAVALLADYVVEYASIARKGQQGPSLSMPCRL